MFLSKSVTKFYKLVVYQTIKKMSAKRSRPGNSSNFTEKDLNHNHMSFPVKYARQVRGASSPSDVQKPPKFLKPSPDEGNKELLWKNTVLKPTAHESVSDGMGSFLKHCYYCKKMIDQGEDVFMYRYNLFTVLCCVAKFIWF